MNENPVCWFEIYVQEMARAKPFYESVLGVKLGEYGFCALAADTEGNVFGLHSMT